MTTITLAMEKKTRDLIELTDKGPYCFKGDFYIDPYRKVEKAIITHGHADHSRFPHTETHCHQHSTPILEKRLGAQNPEFRIHPHEYGEAFSLGDVEVELAPAGHVLGSSQIIIRDGSQTWVLSGDYKRQPDPTCETFLPIPCDVFITEATFALPVYKWHSPDRVLNEAVDWVKKNKSQGLNSCFYAYSLGKAQRLQKMLRQEFSETFYVHGAVDGMNSVYKSVGQELGSWEKANFKKSAKEKLEHYQEAIFIAPPSAYGLGWVKTSGKSRHCFASGWSRLRGQRRRRNYDKGLVLSDHVDWPGLLQTIEETGAKRIIATHGRSDILVRYLQEKGLKAEAWRKTRDVDLED